MKKSTRYKFLILATTLLMTLSRVNAESIPISTDYGNHAWPVDAVNMVSGSRLDGLIGNDSSSFVYGLFTGTKPLRITYQQPIESSVTIITSRVYGDSTVGNRHDIEYSVDGINWTLVDDTEFTDMNTAWIHPDSATAFNLWYSLYSVDINLDLAEPITNFWVRAVENANFVGVANTSPGIENDIFKPIVDIVTIQNGKALLVYNHACDGAGIRVTKLFSNVNRERNLEGKIVWSLLAKQRGYAGTCNDFKLIGLYSSSVVKGDFIRFKVVTVDKSGLRTVKIIKARVKRNLELRFL